MPITPINIQKMKKQAQKQALRDYRELVTKQQELLKAQDGQVRALLNEINKWDVLLKAAHEQIAAHIDQIAVLLVLAKWESQKTSEAA